jgi:hypothetical protein
VDLRGDRIVLADVRGDLAGGTLSASGEAPLAALLPGGNHTSDTETIQLSTDGR